MIKTKQILLHKFLIFASNLQLILFKKHQLKIVVVIFALFLSFYGFIDKKKSENNFSKQTFFFIVESSDLLEIL